MTEEQLETFVAVAENGSFSAAAERLFLTQPTVTHRIMMLENEIGAVLFIRGRRNVTLTPIGQRILDIAGDILKGMWQIHAAATGTGHTQPIKVGFPEMMLHGEKKAFIALLRQTNALSGISVDLCPLEKDKPHALQLLDGNVDIIFTDIDLPMLNAGDVCTRPMFEAQTYACVDKQSDLAMMETIPLRMLEGRTLLWYTDDTGFSDKAQSVLRQAGVCLFRTIDKTRAEVLASVPGTDQIAITNIPERSIKGIAYRALEIAPLRIGIAWLKKHESPALSRTMESIMAMPVNVWRK